MRNNKLANCCHKAVLARCHTLNFNLKRELQRLIKGKGTTRFMDLAAIESGITIQYQRTEMWYPPNRPNNSLLSTN